MKTPPLPMLSRWIMALAAISAANLHDLHGAGPYFDVAPGGWHHDSESQVAIVSVQTDTVVWNDGTLKTAALSYTSPTGGTASGDYEGAFNFTVTNGVGWKVEFGNGSAWTVDSSEPPSFAIATGPWRNVTDPEIAVTAVDLYSLGWNDGVDKAMGLAYNTSSGGTTQGDYAGSFRFTITNGIARKVTFGNGSVWVAESGEPNPSAHAPEVEILPAENEIGIAASKMPVVPAAAFALKITDADPGDSVKRIELYLGRKLVATETSPSATSISVMAKEKKGTRKYTVKVFDQGGRVGTATAKVRQKK